MDDHWIVENPDFGELLCMRIERATFRLQWDGWEHDCFDVDTTAGLGTYRRQGATQDDDPEAWEATTYRMRRSGSQWEICVTGDEIEAWRSERKGVLTGRIDFRRSWPNLSLTDEVTPEVERLARLGPLQPGWVRLAPAVSAALEHGGKSS